MAHQQQADFCNEVKSKFPQYFKGKTVLDCGSLDINGNNRFLFEDCTYLGIDIGHGRNVDVVSPIHEFNARDGMFDTIISTECFEHDMHWQASFYNMIRMLTASGLLMFTCATTGRPEHGTRRTSPETAPLVATTPGLWQDYYRNLAPSDYTDFFAMDEIFESHEFRVNQEACDLYFWGVKKTEVDLSRVVKKIS